MVADEVIDCLHKTSTEEMIITELNSRDEETDDRVILHTEWTIRNREKRFVVFSNDRDRLTLLLQYVDHFIKSCLLEL